MKSIVIFFLLVFINACNSKQADSNITASNPAIKSAREALNAYVFDFWVKRDTSAIERAVTPDMIYNYNGGKSTFSYALHKNALKIFGSAFPDLNGKIDQFVSDGKYGAAACTWTGTHSGNLEGILATNNQTIPASGKKISFAVNYIFRIEGGRIAELWETWDEGGVYIDLMKAGEKIKAKL